MKFFFRLWPTTLSHCHTRSSLCPCLLRPGTTAIGPILSLFLCMSFPSGLFCVLWSHSPVAHSITGCVCREEKLCFSTDRTSCVFGKLFATTTMLSLSFSSRIVYLPSADGQNHPTFSISSFSATTLAMFSKIEFDIHNTGCKTSG